MSYSAGFRLRVLRFCSCESDYASALLEDAMQAYEQYLRWRGAGLLDEATDAAIRRYEGAQARPIQLAISRAGDFHVLKL